MKEHIRHFCIPVFPWGKTPPDLDTIIKQAQHAESLGFYSVNMPLINSLDARSAGCFAQFNNKYTLDALSVLPAVVGATKNIRVAVDGIPLFQLPPFGWAKYFASLDVLSKGRIIVGTCLGFGQEGFDTVGLSQKHRGKIADEQLEVITRLWTENDVTHEGRFFQLYGANVDPKPVQKPYPPIWVGGRVASIPRAGRYAECLDPPWPTVEEARTLYVPRLTEESAKWDRKTKLGGWYYTCVRPAGMSAEDLDQWFGVLMDQEIKTDPAEVAIAGSPAQCADKLRAYIDAGVEHFVLDMQRHGLETVESAMEQMTLLAEEVVPLI